MKIVIWHNYTPLSMSDAFKLSKHLKESGHNVLIPDNDFIDLPKKEAIENHKKALDNAKLLIFISDTFDLSNVSYEDKLQLLVTFKSNSFIFSSDEDLTITSLIDSFIEFSNRSK